MACMYKTFFDIVVEPNRVKEVVKWFEGFNIEFFSISDLNPYDMDSNCRIRFENYCWLNNNINRIKKEVKPVEICHSVYENYLNGGLVEVRGL